MFLYNLTTKMATGGVHLIRLLCRSKPINNASLVANHCKSVYIADKMAADGCFQPHGTLGWPLSKSASLVADPCRSVYIAHKMASDGVENTPSAAILSAIYTDLHGSTENKQNVSNIHWSVIHWISDDQQYVSDIHWSAWVKWNSAQWLFAHKGRSANRSWWGSRSHVQWQF